MGDINNKFKDLFETVGNEMYKKVFKNEVNLSVFTYENAVTFFVKERMKVNGAKKCMIAISKDTELKKSNSNKSLQNHRFVVKQILLDEDENPIYKTENSYYGRVLIVDELDQELLGYMNGDIKKIMK
ncbi:hypothetical protein KPL47_18825 [Clostridium estertheticum]|uniref:hypothetical protein n=1 Tax=Clostridium estertheticum TaxID=238834 RepID=UPI001C0B4F7B|nr:hypothetical protein [Clostridium estertheticum]MBU3178382.1 hypothetical protein [Clostridium estertheticum]